jgi:hypothetical protein
MNSLKDDFIDGMKVAVTDFILNEPFKFQG